MDIIQDTRPWGSFRQFTNNEVSTVKIIKVESNKRLSLQYHNKRREFWVVLSGNPIITIGDSKTKASTGDEFFIENKAIHRIEGGSEGGQILEISFGEFDEDDIVRIEDDFGR